MFPKSSAEKSPPARLVLFTFCLSIAGTIASGAHYYAVDLPQQNQEPRRLKAPPFSHYAHYTILYKSPV
jgi:hypothetical protein